MMAANYQHIGGGENRLGRHYSRFSAFWPPAALADQSLALRKSQNAGSNRRSRAKSLLLALTGCVGLSVNTSVVGGTPAVLPSVPVLLSLSSRPEEFHLRALPEPCVTLSSHTAPVVQPLRTALPRPQAPPVSSWPVAKAEQRSPFAPAPLQGLRRYYGLLRPCAPLRYSRPCGWSRLRLVPSRGQRDEAQLLTFHYESLVELRATSTPDAARAVSGHPPSWSRRKGHPPVLTSPNPLSTLLQRFACARLSRPCLPKSGPGVSATLTTTAFARSSLRWLEIGS